MRNTKEAIYITLEISVAIFIIIFGYAIWDNFDLSTHEIAKTNNSTNEVEILTEENNLYVHNIGKTNNNVKLMIKIDKNVLSNTKNMILELDNKQYNLKELNCGSDEYYNYYDLYYIDFKSYETKNYEFNIIKDSDTLIEYEFITV